MLTQSRGAFLALLGMALPSGIALVRQRPRVAVGFAVLVGVALYLGPCRVVGAPGRACARPPVSQRSAKWTPRGPRENGLRCSADRRPLDREPPGARRGLGAYAQANARYSPAVGQRDTHQHILEHRSGAGLPGLVLFLGLVTSVCVCARHVRRAWPGRTEVVRWLQYGFLGYLIAGMFASFSKLHVPVHLPQPALELRRKRCKRRVPRRAPPNRCDPTRSRHDIADRHPSGAFEHRGRRQPEPTRNMSGSQ